MAGYGIIFFGLWLVHSLPHAYNCNALSTTTTQTRDVGIRPDRSIINANVGREYCEGCNRPPAQCLCAHLPSKKVSLETQVLVLQHPVEFRRQTISTVPLLKLVLEHCRVLVGRSFNNAANPLETIIDDACSDGRIPLLLFPGPGAITLEDTDAMEQLVRAHCYSHDVKIQPSLDVPSKHLLIIVDGTWTQAKGMLRNSPILLEKCHAVQFTGTSDPSIYDSIRKQPDSHCLSTLESCERTLQLLEPNNPRMNEASSHLLNSLRAMILTQMKYERIYLEKNPDLVRNVSKLREKKKRQEHILSTSPKIMEKDTNLRNTAMPEGYTLRSLSPPDAVYVDSIWPFRSNKSLIMIEKQIIADNKNATRTGASTCLGIEHDASLVACVIRHRNGSMGILHVDEDHRRRGLGKMLLHAAMVSMKDREEPMFAYILDGNNASEAVFSKLGWKKADPSEKKGTGKRRAKRLWKFSVTK